MGLKFDENLQEIGIVLNETQKQQFDVFYEMLVEWNKVMNLTGITKRDEVDEKHFVDSLSVVQVFDVDKCKKVIDVGTGAGFPGIPLKILFPDMEITLLDSLNKRIQFLNAVIEELGLKKSTRSTEEQRILPKRKSTGNSMICVYPEQSRIFPLCLSTAFPT